MKLKVFLFVIAAYFIFQSSTAWEGAAVVAPAGELPVSGFFVATNSFPRNSVVDITNIENNRTIRVVVAGTLNSPGLIAAVSHEAAGLLGMRSGSISRIKMLAPSDPLAFHRFTDSLAHDIPLFDLGGVIRTEEELLAEVFGNEPLNPFAVIQPEVEPQPPLTPELRGPSFVLEPEWGGDSRLEIVTIPRFVEEPLTPFDPLPLIEREDTIFVVAPIEAEPEPVHVAEVSELPVLIDDPWLFLENELTELTDTVAEQPPPRVEFTFVETEERVPDFGIYGIDPNDIIPGIAVREIPREPVTDPNFAELILQESIAPIRPEPVIQVHQPLQQRFSIPTITSLASGQFYVQLVALSQERIENAITQFNSHLLHYEPVVFRGSDDLYRILIGPLNQGESAAILARFRSIGYRDAFVRRGG